MSILPHRKTCKCPPHTQGSGRLIRSILLCFTLIACLLAGLSALASPTVISRATLYYSCNQKSGTNVLDLNGTNQGALGNTNVFFSYANDLGRYCLTKLDDNQAGLTPSAPPISNSTFTVSCWAKPTAASTAFFLMEEGPYFNEKSYRIFNNAINYQFSDGDTYPNRSGACPVDSRWHHFVWVNQDNTNGTANLRMYVDGAKVYDGQLAANEYGSAVGLSQEFLVQRPYSVLYYQFVGAICEIAAFDKLALSDVEVAELTRETRPTPVLDQATLYYPCDQTNGTTVLDTHGANHGTLDNTNAFFSYSRELGRYCLTKLNDPQAGLTPTVAPITNVNFSLSCWAKPAAASSGFFLLASNSGLTEMNYRIFGNQINYQYSTVGNFPNRSGNFTADGRWHHFVWVTQNNNNGTGHLGMYVDGLKLYDGQLSDSEFTAAVGILQKFLVQSPYSPLYYQFIGEICNIAAFNNVALSDQEAAKLTKETSPFLADHATLYYECNQASGTTVLDSRGANHGSLDNANVSFHYSTELGRFCLQKLNDNQAGITPLVPPITNATFTVACWAKPTADSTAFFMMNKEGYTAEKSYRIFKGSIDYQYSAFGNYPTQSGTYPTDGWWHHFVWVNQDTNNDTANLRLYVDGVKLYDGVLAANAYTSLVGVQQKFLVQRPYSPLYYQFVGEICNIAVFDHLALSDAEVAQFSQQQSHPYVLSRATLYYPCDQINGTTVLDSMGTNNGTLDTGNVYFRYSSDLGRYCLTKLPDNQAGLTPSANPISQPTFSLACWAKPAANSSGFFLDKGYFPKCVSEKG